MSGTERRSINPPPTGQIHDTLHFSQATRVGNTIWVSGQVGIEPTTKTPGDGARTQARLAFENVRAVLRAAGARLADVVELTTFHTDLQNDGPAFSAVKDEYIGAPYPSWTAVGVTQLARPDLLVEVRAVAVAGSGDSG
ncbi:RidA family protein [Nocardiopsis salina]|uniref:RidA family protein n=1 Tax=Nocardiopsis salina TaxID=245836 RepID=UPI00034A37CA|nr:RidA family protein [Nocardiopsis salina]